MSHKFFRLFISVMLALVAGFAPTNTSFAMGFYVNSTFDGVDANPGDGVCDIGTGECTLRAAIQEANALPGNDAIALPAGDYILAISGDNEDASITGDLDITDNLTINGTDNASSIIDGGAIDRVFHILSGSSVEITGATIQNGRILARGGGLYVEAGTLVLNNSIIRNNTATWGGIFNDSGSTATLNSSTVMDNVGFYNGGGIYNQGTITLNNSTVSGNTAGTGGGFDSDGLTILNNSTISGNTAPDAGGFYVSSGSLFLNNSTVSNNSATGQGGGIYKAGVSTVALKNSIVAGNSALTGPDCYGDIYSPIASSGYNLIGNSSDCIMISASGDLLDVDPLLAPLADNGGPTLTHSLLPSSPSIDAGNPAGCTDQDGNPFTIDQREVARPQGPRCDIGAFEFEGEPGLPPSNDNFADAAIINTLPFSDSIDNTFATVETDEPLPTNCYSVQNTIWYAFTPAETMVIRASVDGSEIDSNLNVYSGAGGGFSDLSFWGCTSTGYAPVILTLEAGQTYYLQAGSIYGETETVQINLEQIPPPVNDYFANAEAITSLPFTSTVDNAAATRELDEPDQCWGTSNTVWYSFTPSETIMVQADTNGSGLSASINIYRAVGSGITQLEPVPMTCTVYYNGIFLAEAGQTYYLQAGGQYPGQTGNLQVNLKQIFPPPNDNFANAESITSLPISVTVDIAGAGIESSEPSGCNSMTRTVWYSFTPTETMNVRINTEGSTIFTNAHVYQMNGSGISDLSLLGCVAWGGSVNFTAMAGQTYYLQAGGDAGTIQFNIEQTYPPPNDNFNDAMVIGTLPFSNTVDITDATTEPGEPQYCYYSSRTVWYSFTSTANMLVQADMLGSEFGDTIFNVYQSVGPGFGGLNFMQCASYSSSATFRVQAGVTYYFQAGSIAGSGGNMQFNLQQLPLPPNDDFANAKAITALPFSDIVDISNATREANEPSYCYYSSKTVWYSFTPTENTLIKVDMQGSSFWDNVFNVYQAIGPNITDLSPLQCAGFGSSVTFTAQAGTTYYIQAGSYYGSSGNMQLNLVELPRPANDDFDKATLVSLPLPFDNTVDTQYATREMGEPTPSCVYNGPGTRSVWYAFTPAASGSVSANIPSSWFTPVLAAYTGNSLNNLTQIGCQTYSNLLTFHVNAGTTYYFQVGNLSPWEQGGSVQFHLDVTPPPTAGFYYYPSDPSIFDTIQFSDSSYDPGQVGFDSVTWDFGDGTTSVAFYPTHIYAKDGDYTVQHSVTTFDGRTASVTQVVHVRTHDVAITKINAPQSASAKQTRAITVSVNSKGYAETVRVDLYKSVPGGFEFIGSVTLPVPARSNNKTIVFNFSYTFTNSDASIGKVTFKAVATIIDARDAYPADNEAVSSPPTKITK